MFGIGPQELVVIGLLFVLIFGAEKASGMARDVGRFVNEARRPVEELKGELLSTIEDRDDPARSGPRTDKEKGQVPQLGEERKPRREEASPTEKHAHTKQQGQP